MLPTPYPIPTTHQKYKEFHDLANDADWAGDHDLANSLRRIALQYRTRHLAGDLYDPPF